ncbi:retrovirus-related pol polyprotein from transposon TNT 1-94 [Tanacetum coccineum]
MAAYAFIAAEEEDTHEPLTYQEAVACEDSSKWKAAMKEEMGSLRKNKTWELIDHLAEQKLVSCKWLFKIKEWIKVVQKPRYKARLVAHGFTQRADYELEQLIIDDIFTWKSEEKLSTMRQPPDMKQVTGVMHPARLEWVYQAKKILGMEIVRESEIVRSEGVTIRQRYNPRRALSTTKAEVNGPYGGCEGSYLAKGTLGRVRLITLSERSWKQTRSRGTRSTPKSKPAASKPKLKGVQSLTPEEQEAADVMQTLKERDPDESTVISATSSEGTVLGLLYS